MEIHAELWMSPGYIMFQLVLSSGIQGKPCSKLLHFGLQQWWNLEQDMHAESKQFCHDDVNLSFGFPFCWIINVFDAIDFI